jgi:hypothetical protein
MNQKDEIQRLLQLKIDQYEGQLTADVLNRFSIEVMQAFNRKVRSEAEGLTPEQLHGLLHFLFTEHSLVKLNTLIKNETALQSPLLRLCISFLEIIQRDEFIKLTKTGALPVKIVAELYGKRNIEEMILTTAAKVRTEKDSISIQLVKIVSQIAGLTKKREGKLSLTAKGISLVKSPAKLLILFTETYFIKFAWSYFDRYESKHAAQFGAGYTLVLLHKYGQQEREASFYSVKFLEAFPTMADEFSPMFTRSREEHFSFCFVWRTFQRGFNWLGLVQTRETGRRNDGTDQVWIKTTPLFDELVKVMGI